MICLAILAWRVAEILLPDQATLPEQALGRAPGGSAAPGLPMLARGSGPGAMACKLLHLTLTLKYPPPRSVQSLLAPADIWQAFSSVSTAGM